MAKKVAKKKTTAKKTAAKKKAPARKKAQARKKAPQAEMLLVGSKAKAAKTEEAETKEG